MPPVTPLHDETFRNQKIIGAPRILGDVSLSRCTFTGSAVAQYDDPGFGLVIRNVESRRCRVDNSAVHGVRFESVLLEDLAVTSGIQLEACVFSEVVVRGNCGRIVTTPPNYALSEEIRQKFVEGMRAAYRQIKWALDIREAKFSDSDFYYVPGELIRRDEETQFLLRRELFDGVRISDLPPYAGISASRFESSPWNSIVAVAPRRSKHFRQYLSDLQELRDMGLAE